MLDLVKNILDFLKSVITFNNVAPFGAGCPSALVLAINLYNAILTALGSQWAKFAWIVAALSMLTMVWIEASGYKQAARAFATGEMKAALLSLAAALFCSIMVAIGVYTGVNTRSLLSSQGYSVACFALIAIGSWMSTKDEKKKEAADAGTTHIQAQTDYVKAQAELEKQKASQARAAARIAQAGGQSDASGGVRRTTGQKRLNHETLQKVREYMAAHSGEKISVRALEEAKIIGHSQAAYYIAAVLDERKKAQSEQ